MRAAFPGAEDMGAPSTDVILTAGATASGSLGLILAQVAPQVPEASWFFVAASAIGFLSLTVKSLFEYLGKRLDHDEAMAELRSLRAELAVHRARLREPKP
jgi:hypothetical protein